LDYDSDSTTPAHQQELIPVAPVQHPMDMETAELPDVAGTRPASKLDAVYYQCRATRINGFKDTLVSISTDSTFGKKIISQSPSVGTLEDHDGIEKTFHGTRVLKGNTLISQTISSSLIHLRWSVCRVHQNMKLL
jgi:hypothetical protein